MTTIKPYRESKCIDCMQEGDYSIKMTMGGRCFKEPFHYQKHQQAKYKAKQEGKEKKVYKINKVSDKQKKASTEYSKARKEYLSDHEVCEANLPGCGYVASEIHHQAGRIGSRLTDKDNFLAVCRNCHNWIESNVIESKELGFSEDRLKNKLSKN